MDVLTFDELTGKVKMCKNKVRGKMKDKKEKFPKPFPFSTRIFVWDEAEVNEWMEEQKEKARKK